MLFIQLHLSSPKTEKKGNKCFEIYLINFEERVLL